MNSSRFILKFCGTFFISYLHLNLKDVAMLSKLSLLIMILAGDKMTLTHLPCQYPVLCMRSNELPLLRPGTVIHISISGHLIIASEYRLGECLIRIHYLNQCYLFQSNAKKIYKVHLKMPSAKCKPVCSGLKVLAPWGRVMPICVSKLTIAGWDNGLLPDWCQAIIWTNAGIFLIEPLGTNFSEIFIEIHTFSFQENVFENVVWKWQPFCLGLNVLAFLMLSLEYSERTCSSSNGRGYVG